MSYRNQVTFVANSRSGHYGIINWFMHQCQRPSAHWACIDQSYENGILTDPRPAHDRAVWWYTDAYYDNNPHRVRQTPVELGTDLYPRDLDTLAWSYENRTMTEVLYRENEIGVQGLKATIVRDLFNYLAGIVNGLAASSDDGYTKMQWADHWVDQVHWAFNQDPRVVGISYNDWFASPTAREKIAVKLGVVHSDVGLNQVLPTGGGSAWDRTAFDGNAQEMGVTRRWMQALAGPRGEYYARILKERPDLVELSLKHFSVEPDQDLWRKPEIWRK